MYEAHFGLQRRPFASVPRVDTYFASDDMESARTALVRCIQRAEGAGLIVGPSGTGKTLLCQIVAEQLGSQFAVALLSSGRLGSRRALLQAILYALQRPYRGMDEGELRLALIDYLTVEEQRPEALVLIVDEAHTLPLRLLDEIRMLTNLSFEGNPKIRLILAGAPALEERLSSPRLESFSQRIVARFYLEPLGRADTDRYVRAQLSIAGSRNGAVFDDQACQSVYRATDGVPRLINQVCDHAMLLACAGGQSHVGAALIEEAWADLQQLPTPWSGEARSTAPTGVVEFGRLDDEPPFAAPDRNDFVATDATCDPETPDDAGDPMVRLDHIQATLAEIEDDFQPAGSIGPEVELVFDECLNPFRETFAEETVLIDRYGTPVTAELKRDLGVRLEPIPQPGPPPPSPDVLPAAYDPDAYGEPGEDPYRPLDPSYERDSNEDVTGVRSGAPYSEERENVPAGSPETAGGDEETSWKADGARGEPLWDDEPETLLLHRRHVPASQTTEVGGDADLIVVEDGYEAMETPHRRRVAAVRSHEYGRLFARLRKSC